MDIILLQKQEETSQKLFVVSKQLVNYWKEHFNYDMYKHSFDQIFNTLASINSFSNFKDLIEQNYNNMQNIINQQNFEKRYNDKLGETVWFNKNILKLGNFDNILDEETYNYFKKYLETSHDSVIKGLILDDKIILQNYKD